MTTTFLSWVATYAIHSTVLIGATWAICRFVPRLALGTQAALWKLALFGGIATATVQMGAGLSSPWGAIDLPMPIHSEPPAVATPSREPVARRVLHHRAGELTITATRAAVVPPVVDVRATANPAASAWPWVIIAAVIGGALFGLVRLGVSLRRLRRQLAGRRDVVEDPILETFLGLCHKAGLRTRVRLSASSTLASAVALRREICIPERAIEGLTPRQQEGMLAHELAHVIRRDPVWVVVAALVEAVFFFQPLNHLVRRKIEEISEYQCDDWAARHTGTGLHLAKCLGEVAGWIEREPVAPLCANMATPRSPIVRRITRLLDDRWRSAVEVAPAWRVGAGLALLGAVTWLSPGVSAAIAAPSASVAGGNGAQPSEPVAMVVEDIPGDGRTDRARVRITGTGQSIDVDVAAPRPPAIVEPPPPPAVPPPQWHIIVQGDVEFDSWSAWQGILGLEIRGFGDLDDWAEAFEDDLDRFELEIDAHGGALDELAEAFEDSPDVLERAFDDWGALRRDRLTRAAEARREAAQARRAAAEARRAAAEARRDVTASWREAAHAARETAAHAFEHESDAASAQRAQADAALSLGPSALVEL